MEFPSLDQDRVMSTSQQQPLPSCLQTTRQPVALPLSPRDLNNFPVFKRSPSADYFKPSPLSSHKILHNDSARIHHEVSSQETPSKPHYMHLENQLLSNVEVCNPAFHSVTSVRECSEPSDLDAKPNVSSPSAHASCNCSLAQSKSSSCPTTAYSSSSATAHAQDLEGRMNYSTLSSSLVLSSSLFHQAFKRRAGH